MAQCVLVAEPSEVLANIGINSHDCFMFMYYTYVVDCPPFIHVFNHHSEVCYATIHHLLEPSLLL